MSVSCPRSIGLFLILGAASSVTATEIGEGVHKVGNSPVELRSSACRYATELSRFDFDALNASHQADGRDLVDVETRWDGYQARYSAVWYPLGGTIYTLIYATPSEWNTFITNMALKNGRYLDFEVGYFGSTGTLKRYSAIFYEDEFGDDYDNALHTTNSDALFQDRLQQYFLEGRAIVDFESYVDPGGSVQYAGLWAGDPHQPRTAFYHGLESADVSDLLRPLNGRVIDFERYWSPTHGEHRYALILAMFPGGDWGLYRSITSTELDGWHSLIADTDTHLTDIEVWEDGGSVHYGAVWGDSYKTLYEVSAIPPDTQPQPLSSNLTTLINSFEGPDESLGSLGLYAKNVFSGQTLAWRESTPFYLASTAKIAVHIKLWQEVQAGRIDLNTFAPYTNCADCRDDWYVSEDDPPGFSSADFGSWFTIDHFDRAMMQVSDNAATSMLVDHPVHGVSHDVTDLNEWLSGLSGIGQGFFPVTSIHDVDRTILWQGQVEDYPTDTSYFLIPGWAFEPYFRWGTDTWGDLEDFLGTPVLPRYHYNNGHERYYNMGLNSATPKACTRLMEGLAAHWFLDAAHSETALEVMTEDTHFSDPLPGFQAPIEIFAKGGVKGGARHPVSDAGAYRLGPDTVVVGVFTQFNSRTVSDIRENFVGPIGREALESLAADLETFANNFGFEPTTVWAGRDFEVFVAVLNQGGGDTRPFDVAFYASTNQIISPGDKHIATVRVSGVNGNSYGIAHFAGVFPDAGSVPLGQYFVGWIIDPSIDPIWGEVGELDESEESNRGFDPSGKLTVISHAIFNDGFEGGNTSSWSVTTF